MRGTATIQIGVLLHLPEHQILVQRATVHADANRFVVIDGHLADGAELLVTPPTRPDVARIDAVLVQRRRAVSVFRQQNMTVVMEVANERYRAPSVDQSALNGRYRGGCLRQIHRHAQHLGSGPPQIETLARRRLDVGRVGVVHRLHDNRCAAADLHVSDANSDGAVALYRRHPVLNPN